MGDNEAADFMDMWREYQRHRAERFIKPLIDELNESGEIGWDAEDVGVQWPPLPSRGYDEDGNLVYKRTDLEYLED